MKQIKSVCGYTDCASIRNNSCDRGMFIRFDFAERRLYWVCRDPDGERLIPQRREELIGRMDLNKVSLLGLKDLLEAYAESLL